MWKEYHYFNIKTDKLTATTSKENEILSGFYVKDVSLYFLRSLKQTREFIREKIGIIWSMIEVFAVKFAVELCEIF